MHTAGNAVPEYTQSSNKVKKESSAENLPGRHASEMSFKSICTCPLKAFMHTYGAIFIAIVFSSSLYDRKHFKD